MGFSPFTDEQSSDALAIQQLVASFPDAVNLRDVELFTSLWAPEAVLEIVGYGVRLQGVEQIRAGATTLINDTYEFLLQIHSAPTLTFSAGGAGDRATGRVYGDEIARRLGGGAPMRAIGIYDDNYVRVNGQWLFASRIYHFLFRDEETFIPAASSPAPSLAIVH